MAEDNYGFNNLSSGYGAPDNGGYGVQNNMSSGYGVPGMESGYGMQSNMASGYGVPGMESGYGMQSNMGSGYGLPGTESGYGLQSNMSSGYGLPGTESGYGLQSNMASGYGLPGTESGYGLASNMQSGYGLPGTESGYGLQSNMSSGYGLPGTESGYGVQNNMQSGYGLPGMDSGYGAGSNMGSGYGASNNAGGFGQNTFGVQSTNGFGVATNQAFGNPEAFTTNVPSTTESSSNVNTAKPLTAKEYEAAAGAPLTGSKKMLCDILSTMDNNTSMYSNDSNQILFASDKRVEDYILNYSLIAWFVQLSADDKKVFTNRLNDVCFFDILVAGGGAPKQIKFETKKVHKDYAYYVPMIFSGERPNVETTQDINIHYSAAAAAVDNVKAGANIQINDKSQMNIIFLKSPDGNQLFPLFTDFESVKKICPDQRVAKLTFTECMEFAANVPNVVYDPLFSNVIVPRDLVKDLSGVVSCDSPEDRFQTLIKLYLNSDGKIHDDAYIHMCQDIFIKKDWWTIIRPEYLARNKVEAYIRILKTHGGSVPEVMLFSDKASAEKWCAKNSQFTYQGIPCIGRIKEDQMKNFLFFLMLQNPYMGVLVDETLSAWGDSLANIFENNGISPSEVKLSDDVISQTLADGVPSAAPFLEKERTF